MSEAKAQRPAPRIIRVDHADAVLARLQSDIFPADTPAPASIGEWFLAVDEDGAAVAFAGMVPVKSWPGAWYLNRAGVVPDWRGHGLQRRLIHARVRRATRYKAPAAISATMPWNVPSMSNLLRCGFGPYWPERPWLDGGCYWMRWL